MFCPNCGNQIPDNTVVCLKCGVPVTNVNVVAGNGGISKGDDLLLRLAIPVGRSGIAILAGYLGIFSVVPFVGILSLIVGILALRDIRNHPEKHGRGRAYFAIIMGVVFSLLYAIVFLSKS